MRSVILLTVICFFTVLISAQHIPFATRVIEYKPAPGQFINDPATGTPAVSAGILNEPGDALSLGGYGGYVILGFDHRIINDPANPYGVDFTVFGNPMSSNSEQGIIRVMRDDNNNHIPDDIWYEIMGSDHFGSLKKNYEITYYNTGTSTSDLPWKDNQGNQGYILKNNFHTQPYYPLNSLFPEINKDSFSFKGNLLSPRIEKIKGVFVSHSSAFGYADNTPVNAGNNYFSPDNPYTLNLIEGSGGDAIDISWAADTSGQYVDLDGIDFIMIYSGINANLSWLGEISTEIRGIADVAPSSLTGKTDLILPTNLPDKIAVSSTLNLRSLFFESGRQKKGQNIEWISSDNSRVIIKEDTVIQAINPGEVKLSARLKNSTEILFEKSLIISIPTELRIENIPTNIIQDQVFSLNYTILDEYGDRLTGIIPEIAISGSDLIQIVNEDEGILVLKATGSGIAEISFNVPGFSALNRIQKLIINNNISHFEVSVSFITDNSTVLPAKDYTVSKQDLSAFIDRMQAGFIPGRNFISIADVLVSVLSSEGYGSGPNTFLFRQDEFGDNKLYLWKFGKNYEYTYGWGGTSINDTYAKAWIAIVNNSAFANGLDTIEVFPGDIICFRHVKDIRNEWSHVQVVPDRKLSQPGEDIGFIVRKLVIAPNQQNILSVSGSLLPDAKVLVNMNPVFQNNIPLLSAFNGEFSLNFPQSGRYFVGVDKAFSETSEINVSDVIGGRDILYNSVEVFPNPFFDEIRLKTDDLSIEYIRLYSIDGKLIMNKNILVGKTEHTIESGNLPKGIYVLQLGTNDKVITKKIIKELQ